MDSLLPFLGHGLAQVLLFALLVCAGGVVPAPREAPPLLTFALRACWGVALLFWACALAGWLGVLHPMVLGALLLGLAAAGWWCSPPVNPTLPLPRLWSLRLFAAGLVLLVVNVFLGAMVPDFSQDSMWYHLSVPQEWGFLGAIRPLPYVMPSCYPLAVEAFYAVLLPWLGSVGCSGFYAAGTVLLWVLVLGACRWLAPQGATAAAILLVPLLAATTVAPVPAGNDNWAALFLLAGFVPLLGLDAGPRGALKAGFLLGTAVACKPVVVAFLPFVVLGAAWSTRHPWRTLPASLGSLAAGAFFAYLPWLLIGVGSTGLPLFPLGASLFTVRPEFVPALEASRSLNSLYPLTVGGLSEALLAGLPRKIYTAFHAGSPLSFLAPGVALVAALACTGCGRRIAITVLAAFGPVVLLRGSTELLRYYGLLFPLAALPAGLLLATVREHLTPRRGELLTVLLGLASFGTFALAQHRVASFPTIAWQYRPMLSPMDRRLHQQRVEFGGSVFAFDLIRPLIPPQDRVLLPDCTHPFALHRPATWNDFAVAGGLRDAWAGTREAMAGAKLLRREGARWVLVEGQRPDVANPALCRDLEALGILQPVALPAGAEPWRLYRVELPAPP